jgi:hypothetical protein
MPKEKFWRSFDRAPGGDPDLIVEWGACKIPKHEGDNCHALVIHGGGLMFRSDDLSGLDRLIRVLKRARRSLRGTQTEGDIAIDIVRETRAEV